MSTVHVISGNASFGLFCLKMFLNLLKSRLFPGPNFVVSSRFQHAIGIVEKSKSELLQWGFSQRQANIILSHLDSYLKQDTHQLIKTSMTCWRKHMQNKKGDFEDNDTAFKEVFVNKEPRLLLLKDDFILERMELLKGLDFLRGHNDLWQMFVRVPTGCFLQDWSEFLKKYYFLTFKVLPFVEPEFNQHNILNPIFKCPEVLEQSYIHLKTRFLFAQLPDKEFLKRCAPYCLLEEYNALEKLNSLLPGEEDDKLFDELIELAPKYGVDGEGKSLNRKFIEDALKDHTFTFSSKDRP